MSSESRLTQSFLQLSDKDFHVVPLLERALVTTLNEFKDEHHGSVGAVLSALAFATGELILASGDDVEGVRSYYLRVLDAYLAQGIDGGRDGPGTEKSLVRRFVPWPTK